MQNTKVGDIYTKLLFKRHNRNEIEKMKIIFLDESGQPGGFDKIKNELTENTSKYFTLGGFMIDADEILKVEKGMKGIKLKYGINQYHEVKWHTTYSKLGLNFNQYKNMKEDIIEFISKYKNSIIGIVVDKKSCYKNKCYINTPNDLYSVALHLLMERYCMEIYKAKEKNNTKPTIMIADSRQSINSNKLDKELKIAYLRAKNMGTHFIEFPNFCENIIFVDSDDFSGIQIADFCAGAIHRKYENEDKTFFDKLKPAIRKHKGTIYGAGIKVYK